MKESKFKIGDTIIGNSKANKYFTITKEGWIGVIVEIENSGSIIARAHNGTKSYDNLPPNCFDLYDENKGKYISLW